MFLGPQKTFILILIVLSFMAESVQAGRKPTAKIRQELLRKQLIEQTKSDEILSGDLCTTSHNRKRKPLPSPAQLEIETPLKKSKIEHEESGTTTQKYYSHLEG